MITTKSCIVHGLFVVTVGCWFQLGVLCVFCREREREGGGVVEDY